MKHTEIENLLPAVFQRTLRAPGPLPVLLDVMESLHAPAEKLLVDLDAAFDPRRARGVMVPFLARWVDLERLFSERDRASAESDFEDPVSTGMGRLRELVAEAAYLSQWRGTTRGLRRFLQVATGCTDFFIDEAVRNPAGDVRPFHVRVRAPAAAQPHRALLQRIIETEKPAYVTYELEFAE